MKTEAVQPHSSAQTVSSSPYSRRRLRRFWWAPAFVWLMTVATACRGGAAENSTAAGEGQSGQTSINAQPVSQLADYPDQDSTGVPKGIELVDSKSIEVKKNGTVIDGLHITGNVTVKADNVVIRNTKITHTGLITIRNEGKNLLVEDSEIDGQGKANPVITESDYTLLRVNIHDVAEGPRIAGGRVTIEDSYIHNIVQLKDNHTDAIQALSGRDIVLRGNNIQAFNPDTGSLGNAAFMFGEEDGAVRDCVVEGNLFNGGNYTVNGGGGGTNRADCSFTDNVFQRDFRFGARGNLGPEVTWDDSNVWLGTHTPVD